jgi:hypothetical protein
MHDLRRSHHRHGPHYQNHGRQPILATSSHILDCRSDWFLSPTHNSPLARAVSKATDSALRSTFLLGLYIVLGTVLGLYLDHIYHLSGR